MGTGKPLQNLMWEIKKSQSRYEGLFRIPVTSDSFYGRPWRIVNAFFAYLAVGVVMTLVGVLGLAGKNVAAKNAVVLALVLATVFNLVPHAYDLVNLLTADQEHLPLTKLLVGLANNRAALRFDISCDGVPDSRRCVDKYGLDTAYAVAWLGAAYSIVWIALTWVLWREKNAVFGTFCCMLSQALVELTFATIHPDLCNMPIVYVAVLCLATQAMMVGVTLRVRFRLKAIMRLDKAFYDEWFETLIIEDHNLKALNQIRKQEQLINHTISESHALEMARHNQRRAQNPGMQMTTQNPAVAAQNPAVACLQVPGLVPDVNRDSLPLAVRRGGAETEAPSITTSSLARVRQMCAAAAPINIRGNSNSNSSHINTYTSSVNYCEFLVEFASLPSHISGMLVLLGLF